MISYTCPKCGSSMSSPDSLAGQHEACPECGNITTIPQSHPVPTSPIQSPPVQNIPFSQPPAINNPPGSPLNVTMKQPKSTNGIGIAALVLGILACLTCWIPFIGMFSIPVSVLGILLGIIGMIISVIGHRSKIGMPVAGTIVCVVAIVVAVASTGGTTRAITEAARETNRKAKATNQEVVPSPKKPTRPSHPVAEKSAPNESKEETWASAQNAIRQANIEIRITQVLVGKIPLRAGFDDSETQSKDKLLKVVLELHNLSKSKKIEYQSWSGRDLSFNRDYATLKDNFGNNYKRINFGFGTKVIGQTKSDSIYPGIKIQDVLVFETPVDTVKYLNLELPAKNFDGEGMLRLRIPTGMIQR